MEVKAFSTKVSDSLAIRAARAPAATPLPTSSVCCARGGSGSLPQSTSGSLLWEGLERADNVHIPFTFSLVLSSDDLIMFRVREKDSFSMRSLYERHVRDVTFEVSTFVPLCLLLVFH